MRRWLGGKPGGLAAFLIIAALVAGGLGWATRAALRLEREQLEQAEAAEHADRLSRALWRLDSRIAAILAREDSRPFDHYSAVHAPPLALNADGQCWPAGAVVEPSPLLDADVAPWMLLHFQTDTSGWQSPQVLSATLEKFLRDPHLALQLRNVTAPRKRLLEELSKELPGAVLLDHAHRFAGQTTIRDRVLLARVQDELQNPSGNRTAAANAELGRREFAYRSGAQSKLPGNYMLAQRIDKDVALLNTCRNGEVWLGTRLDTLKEAEGYGRKKKDKQAESSAPPSSPTPPSRPTSTSGGVTAAQNGTRASSPAGAGRVLALVRIPPSAEVEVKLSPMVGLWLPTKAKGDRLVVLRLVRVARKELCQGIVLDSDKLADLLAEEVQDLFPDARLRPAREMDADDLPRMMTTLPLYLDAGPVPAADDPGWTPLRAGLSLAWLASGVALLAVALGGWSLLSLSERRIRFVSAVTHELRTPLTTLQLYLDMLLGGLVRDEKQRKEYLQTLHAETDRLTRLVGNVLDFSRLENHQPRLTLGQAAVADVLAQVQSAWSPRCALGGKELLVENACAAGTAVQTDSVLLQQVLGNLLDNASKHTREADDRRIWLRARQEGGKVHFEVEDRGPGVPSNEQRAIFRAFRRGRCADATTGGVGLGLALARRWTHLLGGRLALAAPSAGGACFRVALREERVSSSAPQGTSDL
jgi:signal transduction histidine kinase